MSSQEILEWVNAIGPLICSWPIVVLLTLGIFRKPLVNLIKQLTESDVKKAKVGPIEIELNKLAKEGKQAVENANRLNVLMAESRLLELEITNNMLDQRVSLEHRQQMQKHIDELGNLIQKIKVSEDQNSKLVSTR